MSAWVSFKSVVDPSDCDFLGHMNVSRYFAACSDAVTALQCELGLTGRDMRGGRRLSFAVVHAESDFRAELSAGDSIWMESGIEVIGGKSMTFRHELYRAPARELAFATRFKCVLLSLETRRAVDIPDDLRAAAEKFLTASSSVG